MEFVYVDIVTLWTKLVVNFISKCSITLYSPLLSPPGNGVVINSAKGSDINFTSAQPCWVGEWRRYLISIKNSTKIVVVLQKVPPTIVRAIMVVCCICTKDSTTETKFCTNVCGALN